VKISGQISSAGIKPAEVPKTDECLFTDTGLNERGENERQCENDSEMKTVSYVKGPENQQELMRTRLRRKGVFKEKRLEFRVKLMRVEDK